MRISYKIKSEDIIAWNVQHLNQVPRLKKLQLRNRLIISSLYGLIAISWFIYEPAHWPFAWILMFLAVLWYLFYPTVSDYRMIKKIGKAFKDREFGVKELRFNDDGIWAKNGIREGDIPWVAIKRIVYSDQYIFIYLTEDDALIIPRNGIDDFISWEKLSDCIKAWGEKNAISIGFSNL